MLKAFLHAGLVFAGLCAWGAPAAEAEIYRWVDASGTPHFSNRVEEVPADARAQLRRAAGEAPVAPAAGGLQILPGLPGSAGADRGHPDDPGISEHPFRALASAGAGDAVAQLTPVALAGAALGLLFVLGIGVAFGAVVLLVACRLCRDSSPGFARALGIAGSQMLAGVACVAVLALVLGPGVEAQAGAFVCNIGIGAVILRGMHCRTFGKAAVVSLVSVAVGWAMGLALGALAVCAGAGVAVLSASGAA